MCGGGGGGGFDITDPIDWRGPGETLSKIDPGPSIGKVGESIDKTVNDVIPGGWITVAALTGGGLALAYAPEVMAFAEANGLTPAAASESLGIAPVNAATGEVVAPDVFAGLSANAPVDTTLSQAAANSIVDLGTQGLTGAIDLPSLTDPSLTTQIGAPQTSTGSFGSITAPATGSGAIPGAGATTLPGGGLTGALPAGTMVGDGTLGTTIGATYMSAGPGQFAVDALGNAIPATSVGIGGFDPTTGLSLNDLNNARKVAQTANQLLSSSSSATPTTTGMGGVGSGTSLGGAGTGALANLNNPTNYQGTLVKGSQIESPLSNFAIPVNNYASPAYNPNQLQEIAQAAEGGIMHPVHLAEGGDPLPEGFFKPWKPVQSRGQKIQGHPGLTAFHGVGLKAGGEPSMQEAHDPQFFSEGGLNAIQHRYVTGAGDGTSDSIPAMLANGEFVIPADVVSSLGNGSNDSGAEVLDSFLKTIREHKQKHNAKHLPPDSKGPLAYLLEAKHKARS
jgi:hypothetical protein